MGNKSSKSKSKSKSRIETNKSNINYNNIGNHYETWDQLVAALRKNGLEKSDLLVAIDFTKSNTWQGKNTFEGKCLHDIERQYVSNTLPPYSPESVPIPISLNPYEYVISIIANALNPFDDDGWIPTIIFGHGRHNSESYIKPIHTDLRGSYKLEGVLQDYRYAVENNQYSGPTTFAPIIDWGINIVKDTGDYHILLIIGDGCVNKEEVPSTIKAIQRASKYPLSIIFVGVGDGDSPDEPDKWKLMRKFDDDIPNRDVDNWNSVYLSDSLEMFKNSLNIDIELATMCLMEVPIQFKYFKKKGLITI